MRRRRKLVAVDLNAGITQDGIARRNVDKVCVYVRDIETRLVEHITAFNAAFGCVAWVTARRVLDVLASRHCSIVLQKENFLRLDRGKDGYSKWLRAKYAQLSCGVKPKEFPPDMASYFSNVDKIYPVRCAGLCTGSKYIAPRCHHKFLVFCTYETEKYGKRANTNVETVIPGRLTPEAVWTGSYNFTVNSGNSLENVVVIHDRTIAAFYLSMFAQIYALAETLNWR